MLIFFIWLAVYFFLFNKYKEKIIYLLPVLEAINILSRHFSDQVGIILSHYLFIIFALFVSLRILFSSKRYPNNFLTKSCYLFVILLLILAFSFSSNVWESFKRTLVVVTPFLIFTALYNMRNISNKTVYSSLKQYYTFVGVLVVYISILSVFGVGIKKDTEYISSEYISEFIKTGHVNFFDMFSIAIFISLYFLFRKYFNRQKGRLTAFTLVSFIILYFTYKRSYIIVVIIGLFLIPYLNSKTEKNKLIGIIKYVLFAIFLGVIVYVPLSTLIEKRGRGFDAEQIISEGRTIEILLYPQVVAIEENPALFLLVGRELFYSSHAFYIITKEFHTGSEGRFLHSDYAHILYGSGFSGLIVYLTIYFLIIIEARKYLKEKSNKRYIAQGSLIIVFCILVGGLGDGILSLPNRLPPMYLLGVFLSYLRSVPPSSNRLQTIK